MLNILGRELKYKHLSREREGVNHSDGGAGAKVKTKNKMEYYNGILCIRGETLIISDSNPEGLLSESYYKKLAYTQGRINVKRRACYGTPALIEYDSVPIKYRRMYEERFGDPRKQAERSPFVEFIEDDAQALQVFSDHLLTDGGTLKPEVIVEYTANATILNAIMQYVRDTRSLRRSLGINTTLGHLWEKVAEVIHEKEVLDLYPHTLPSNPTSLRRRYNLYKEGGYEALIHKGYSNDNSRKVSVFIERLLLSLYTMPNKPFGADVHDMYDLFVKGVIQVYDKSTGELFDRRIFLKNGDPIELSRATVWNYLNNPKNRIVVDEKRNDSLYNSNVHRPFHRRKPPQFAFSKISMDDRDLTRKTHDGRSIKAYYSYDVASGCVVGQSYSLSKNEELFLDCLRETFRTIDASGWGMPMQVEVEHHLVNKFFDDLAMMFPYMRICNPGNSREKRAEHFNKTKKYSAEKKLGHPVGRWWAKSEAYLQPQSRVGDEFVVTKGFYEQIVAEDMEGIKLYNNAPHPKQKTYPGMTRWEVLCNNINPDLPDLNKAMLYRYIGHSAKTSIHNSKEVTVQYGQYQLPDVEIMRRLQPNNYNVTAYYSPNSENIIDEVHLYQGEAFICSCQKINPYNEANAEWTDVDVRSFESQAGYDSSYRKMVKGGKSDLSKIGIMQSETIAGLEKIKVDVVEDPIAPPLSFEEEIQQLNAKYGSASERALHDL